MNGLDDATAWLQQLADAEAAIDSTTGADPDATRIIRPGSVPEIGSELGHYRLEALCGHGGMSLVFRAWDQALERPVALKLIRRDLARTELALLQREASALMRLQHPGIATFHSLDDDGRRAWIAMEFVDGETLAARIRRGGALPARELARLAEGLLRALGHAHDAGVLHGDIKPSNVMLLGDGRIKLLDFGIARLLDPADDHAAGDGSAPFDAGSPGYMAPEQLSTGIVDVRTDLFAVAAVLFQAATGKAAFAGANGRERISTTLGHRSGAIAERLSGALGACLDRALDPSPQRRPDSAAELLFDLREQLGDADQPSARPRLALLDPDLDDGACELGWLGTALNHALAPMIARSGRIELLDSQAVAAARGRAPADDHAAVGRALGADWVIHGRLAQRDDDVELRLWIRDTGTGRALSDHLIRAPRERLFTIQESLSDWVAEQLHLPAPTPVAQVWTEAELCARAERAFQRGGKDGLVEAGRYFGQALTLERASVEALTGMAAVEAMRYTFTADPDCLARAAEHAEAALRIDPTLARARTWLVYVRMRQHRPEDALAQARVITEQGVDSHMACYFAACCLAEQRRFDEALNLYQRSLHQNPRRSWTWLGTGLCHAELGHEDRARWCFRRATEIEPLESEFPTAGCGAFLAEMERRAGQHSRAWQTARTALERVERSDFIYRDTFRAIALCTLGRVALDRGQRQTASAAFGQAVTALRGRPSTLGAGHLLAQALAGRAEADADPRALDEAERVLAESGKWNFEWAWGCTDVDSRRSLDRARQALQPAGTGLTDPPAARR